MPHGKIPVIDQGQDYIGGFTDDDDSAFEGALPVILFGDHTRSIKYVDKPFAVGAEGIKILKPTEGFDPKYFFYLVRSLRIPSRGYSRHFQFLKKFQMPLAPSDQQKRIVSEIEKQFSRLDEAVAALKRIKANLKRYKAAVLKAAVEGKLTEEWRQNNLRRGEAVPRPHNNKNTGHDTERATHEDRAIHRIAPTRGETGADLLKRILAERKKKWEAEYIKKYVGAIHELPLQDDSWKKKYKEPSPPDTSNLPDLPKGWLWATVEQLAAKIQYGSSSKTNKDREGVPVIRMGNIFEGRLELDDLKYLPRNHSEFPELLLKKNDLLFNRTNSPELVGKTAVYKGMPKPCSFASYLIRVQFNDGASSDFVSFCINADYGRRWIKSVVSQQVGQANVNGSKLQALSVPLPPHVEQQKIVEEVESCLSVAEEIEATIETNLKRAERLRQAILKKAFSGTLNWTSLS